jgi:hypothetical protein
MANVTMVDLQKALAIGKNCRSASADVAGAKRRFVATPSPRAMDKAGGQLILQRRCARRLASGTALASSRVIREGRGA